MLINGRIFFGSIEINKYGDGFVFGAQLTGCIGIGTMQLPSDFLIKRTQISWESQGRAGNKARLMWLGFLIQPNSEKNSNSFMPPN
jgi:hypothetical protein